MHMLSENDLTLEERETILKSKDSCHASGEAAPCVNDLDMFIDVQLFGYVIAEEIAGKESGYSCEWKQGESSFLLKGGQRVEW